jgi:hypothetical protein
MQQLGKLVNPVTQKTEVNLEGAQVTIDMLDMLRAKSQGNLDSEEDKMLTSILSDLQMNYVETVGAQPAPNTDDPPAEEAPTVDPSASDDPQDSNDPKFHKSYGSD